MKVEREIIVKLTLTEEEAESLLEVLELPRNDERGQIMIFRRSLFELLKEELHENLMNR